MSAARNLGSGFSSKQLQPGHHQEGPDEDGQEGHQGHRDWARINDSCNLFQYMFIRNVRYCHFLVLSHCSNIGIDISLLHESNCVIV